MSAPTLREQQQRLDEWMTTFNHVRPHEALGMKTPAEFYRPSPRRRTHLRVGGFPLDARLINVPGGGRYAHFDHVRIHVGAAFAGYPIGIRYLDDQRVEVWFFHMRLGTCVPGEHGSFEVDAELVSPPPGQRRARATAEPASVRRTSGTALLLAASWSTSTPLALAMARTTAALTATTVETPSLATAVLDALESLDIEGNRGGLVDLIDLRAELRRRGVVDDDQAVNAALYELERAWQLDLSIAAVRRAGGHQAAPATDGAEAPEAPPVPATNGWAADAARASRTEGVTPCESGCVPPCQPVTPGTPGWLDDVSLKGDTPEVTPLASEVTPVTPGQVTPATGGGDIPGLQVSPTSATAADRAALRLEPPIIPLGWHWVPEASQPSRQANPLNKEPRTTK